MGSEKAKGNPYFFGKLTLSLRNSLLPRRYQERAVEHPAGTVRITVKSVDYPDAKKPVLVANVSGNEKELRPAQEASFSLEDPLGDILIHLYDDFALVKKHAIGRVILPLPTLLQASNSEQLMKIVTGGVDQSADLRCRFFPVGLDKRGRSLHAAKLRPAIHGIPGSGIKKNSVKGNLTISVRVTSEPLMSRMFYPPQVPCWDSLPRFTRPHKDEANLTWWQDLNPKDVKANQIRIFSMLTPPMLLVVVWTDRRAACAAQLMWLLLCRAGAWAIPLFGFVVVVMNGVLVHRHRQQSWKSGNAYEIFEDEVGKSELLAPHEMVLQLQWLIFNLQRLCGTVASVLEAISNAASGADMFVSSVLFVAGALLAVCASIFLWVVPVQIWIYCSGVAFLAGGMRIYPKSKSALDLFREAEQSDRQNMFGLLGDESEEQTKESNSPPCANSPASASPELKEGIEQFGEFASAFLQRIPNELEVAHRYIASHIVVDQLTKHEQH